MVRNDHVFWHLQGILICLGMKNVRIRVDVFPIDGSIRDFGSRNSSPATGSSNSTDEPSALARVHPHQRCWGRSLAVAGELTSWCGPLLRGCLSASRSETPRRRSCTCMPWRIRSGFSIYSLALKSESRIHGREAPLALTDGRRAWNGFPAQEGSSFAALASPQTTSVQIA